MGTTENNEVPFAKSLAFDKTSARSFIYIGKGSKLNVRPWETYALTSLKEQTCPVSTTFCFRFLKKLNNKFKIVIRYAILF